uniref:Uncharacterized protein n=1 Tax=Lepeophtheirus salmonis TaxID=72036 RepID=A0A0K2UPD2_LEPSM
MSRRKTDPRTGLPYYTCSASSSNTTTNNSASSSCVTHSHLKQDEDQEEGQGGTGPQMGATAEETPNDKDKEEDERACGEGLEGNMALKKRSCEGVVVGLSLVAHDTDKNERIIHAQSDEDTILASNDATLVKHYEGILPNVVVQSNDPETELILPGLASVLPTEEEEDADDSSSTTPSKGDPPCTVQVPISFTPRSSSSPKECAILNPSSPLLVTLTCGHLFCPHFGVTRRDLFNVSHFTYRDMMRMWKALFLKPLHLFIIFLLIQTTMKNSRSVQENLLIS